MKQTNKRHILVRYAIVVGIMLAFSAMIVWDLFKTTVVHAAEWNNKAEAVLTYPVPIEPERGKLLADNGTVLAANLQFYVPRIDWFTEGIKEDTLMKDIGPLCDSLAAFDSTKTATQWRQQILQDRKQILDAAKTVGPDGKKGRMNRAYKLFSRMLTHNEYERVRRFPFLRRPKNKNGFYYEKHNRRIKPYGNMAGRSIGNVGQDSTSSSIHGRSGLEMALDSLLYGKPGEAQSIQLTNSIVKAESIPAVKGYDITTTINVQLQDIVENELSNMCAQTGARWGTCVLMEVATGDIKAISNLEWSDDAGAYVEGRNHAVLGYEPGSVVKTISMMVALEDGIISNIDEPIATGRSWSYAGGNPITDHPGGDTRTPRQIIEMSSNIGMAKLIVRKYGDNPPGFRQRLEEMGFFEPFNLGIAGETTPWFQDAKIAYGGRVTLSRQAFGYGSRIPPLCTLAMYNAIANDGKYVRPRLFKKLSRAGEPDSIIPVTYIRKQVCSPENARKLRIMLHDVVWGSHGTARQSVRDDKVEIAGKTGTAFTTTGGQYGSQKRLAFCGFFPYDKPKYSCIVLMLGANVGAGASSGMVVRNVARKMYARGLLGDTPDYVTEKSEDNKPYPTLFASMGDNTANNIKRGLGIQTSHHYARPKRTEQGVPNVVGLNVREAIKMLEDAGLIVHFTGSGMVTGQDLAAGSRYSRGQRINLRLRNS
ncbi:MAG: transpeptidase family protein [Muribaculaceae bacterium]|nr:transpeptidase family protein [Muribaculaceae bacterium]